MHAYISESKDKNFIGTDFIIENCSMEDIEKAKSQFVKFSDENLIETTPYGEVLNKSGEKANIYMNGVKVAVEGNFLFSYNVTSLTKKIRKEINRERTNIGRSAYSERVKTILLNCKSETVATKLSQDLEDSQNNITHDELDGKKFQFMHVRF